MPRALLGRVRRNTGSLGSERSDAIRAVLAAHRMVAAEADVAHALEVEVNGLLSKGKVLATLASFPHPLRMADLTGGVEPHEVDAYVPHVAGVAAGDGSEAAAVWIGRARNVR